MIGPLMSDDTSIIFFIQTLFEKNQTKALRKTHDNSLVKKSQFYYVYSGNFKLSSFSSSLGEEERAKKLAPFIFLSQVFCGFGVNSTLLFYLGFALINSWVLVVCGGGILVCGRCTLQGCPMGML